MTQLMKYKIFKSTLNAFSS